MEEKREEIKFEGLLSVEEEVEFVVLMEDDDEE